MTTRATALLGGHFLVPLLAGVATAMVAVDSAYAALAIVAGTGALLWGLQSPLRVLAVFILMVPFAGTTLLGTPVVPVPGAKPLNLLAAVMMVAFAVTRSRTVALPRDAATFTWVYLLIFTIAFIRSMPYYGHVKPVVDSVQQYVMSYWVKPMVVFLPFVVVVKATTERRDVDLVVKMVVFSMTILAGYITASYVFALGGTASIGEASAYYSSATSMHRNAIATFFMLGFPLALARFFIERTPLTVVCLAVTLAGVGFAFSRTGYVVVPVSVVAYLAISRRTKLLPVLALGCVALSFVLSAAIVDRARTDLDSGDVDKISAGRIDGIWLPLLHEYAKQPQKIVVGGGLRSMTYSEAAARGRILDTGMVHNSYLELLLDTGVVGLVAIVGFFASLMTRLLRGARTVADPVLREYHVAMLVSLGAFMLAGLTGRSFLPRLPNSYLWIVAALSVAVVGLSAAPAACPEDEAP